MFNFRKKSTVTSKKFDSQTSAILELEVAKKRLEMEKEELQLEIGNSKRREQMKLEEESHKHMLKLAEERAIFDREKKVWEIEKKEMQERFVREKTEFENKIKAESELKTNEAVTLTKLESQQLVKQAEINAERKVNELAAKFAQELSEAKSKAAEEYYTKLTAAFTDIQLNGDKNTKFVQELALKALETIPKPTVGVDLRANVGQPKLVSNSAE